LDTRPIACPAFRSCRLRAIFVVVIALGIAGSSGADLLAELAASEAQRIAVPAPPGEALTLEVRTVVSSFSARRGVTFCWIRLPAGRFELWVKDIRRFGEADEIFDAVSELGDAVVVNGSFYGYDVDDEYMPLGLVVSAGKRLFPPMRWTTGGVLERRSDRHRIVRIRDFEADASIDHAIQSKPMLVYDGRNDMIRDDRKHFDRVAVGTNAAGDLVVAGLFGPNGRGGSLFEFAMALLIPESEGGPEMHVALAMDGGPGAHIHLPGIDRHFGFSGTNFVPNSVHFRSRSDHDD